MIKKKRNSKCKMQCKVKIVYNLRSGPLVKYILANIIVKQQNVEKFGLSKDRVQTADDSKKFISHNL